MRAPIHAVKHYTQKTLTTVTVGTINLMSIAKAVISTSANLANEVIEGAIVKAVYVEMWARGQDTSAGSVLISLVKVPDGQGLSFGDQANLFAYTNKKNVLYHTQGLTNHSLDAAVPFVRQWFKIPKGKQRMGLGDELLLGVSAQALDVNICGFAVYKEYR